MAFARSMTRGMSRSRGNDEAEHKVLSDIRDHDWHVMLVREAEGKSPRLSNDAAVQAAYDACFTYTIGLTISFDHPELILVGEWQYAHQIINAAGELIRDGQRFQRGDRSTEVLDGLEVRFDSVSDTKGAELLTWAKWALRGRPLSALQLVLPDPQGRWPEDPDYHSFPQPSLR